MEVLSPAAAVWMCPECGHGSPDPRDERAHLDAHRQLRAFFREWDAGTASGQEHGRRSKRRLVLLYTAAALLLVLLSAGLFSRINGESDGRRPSAPTFVAPDPAVVVPAPPRTTVQGPRAAPTTTVAPRPGRSAPPPAAVTETVSDDGFVAPRAAAAPPAASATVAPPPPAAPAPVPPQAVTAPPTHLVHVCLLGICVTVL